MDVEIDKLEIESGAKDASDRRRKPESPYGEEQLERKIEECVERILRQLMNR